MKPSLPVENLPNPNDLDAVFDFVRSFNGYEHFGSFKAVAENAKARRRETLIDLRNELFFFYRASNHQGGDYKQALADLYRELRPKFLDLLSKE